MNIDWIRELCLSLPGATEQIQWGSDLLFKVGGKMFAGLPLDPSRVWLTIKCSDEDFVELTERPGIIPAPYLGRAKWVALESESALRPAELEELVRKSYAMVFAKLPKKIQAQVATRKSRKAATHRKKRRRS